MTLVATPFCTEVEMKRLFSTAGVDSFADNDNNGSADTGVTDDCINQATSEIADYGTQWYTTTGLASSTTINRWAVVMACFFLCLRRGNDPPDSLKYEFERITNPNDGFLIRLQKGQYKLNGVPMRGDLRPSMSNLQIDRGFAHAKPRVVPTVSSDSPTTLRRNTTREVTSGE